MRKPTRKPTKEIQKRITNKILEQLGGNEFLAMTGAKNFYYAEKENEIYLSFKLPKKYNKFNYVKIFYTVLDNYRIEFGCIKKHTYEILATVYSVYADTLQDIFTEMTGLDTHL